VTDESVVYNLTLGANLTDLYGEYQLNYTNRMEVLPAIGVRCKVSSAVGMANIDGRTSTYTDFERSDTPNPHLDTCMPRMDMAAPAGIIDGSMFDPASGEWVNNIFRSINTPAALTANRTSPNDPASNEDVQYIQLAYMQASDLRHSLLRTYPAYVNELMFNGGFGYSSENGVQNVTFQNMNVTAFESKKVFESGVINLWVPGALLIVWAIGSVTLNVLYGFRRRWSATLDGYSMFRFGADLAERVRDRPEFGINMGFEDCHVLRDIPGLIGDANVNAEPGHITLVAGKEALADKGKL
jgi:hypothetical protein